MPDAGWLTPVTSSAWKRVADILSADAGTTMLAWLSIKKAALGWNWCDLEMGKLL
jgi:hypothetical protein